MEDRALKTQSQSCPGRFCRKYYEAIFNQRTEKILTIYKPKIIEVKLMTDN